MDKAEILFILLKWAAALSGYDMQEVPQVERVSHAYLVEHACYNVECNVVGWYNDQSIVYIDEKYASFEDGFVSSLIVHEFTHYLQHKDGYWHQTLMTCEKFIAREREAYFVQNQYIEKNLATTSKVAPKPVSCP